MESDGQGSRVRRALARLGAHARAEARALWRDDPLFVLLGVAGFVMLGCHALVAWLR
jgi:hypothetical protein